MDADCLIDVLSYLYFKFNFFIAVTGRGITACNTYCVPVWSAIKPVITIGHWNIHLKSMVEKHSAGRNKICDTYTLWTYFWRLPGVSREPFRRTLILWKALIFCLKNDGLLLTFNKLHLPNSSAKIGRSRPTNRISKSDNLPEFNVSTNVIKLPRTGLLRGLHSGYLFYFWHSTHNGV